MFSPIYQYSLFQKMHSVCVSLKLFISSFFPLISYYLVENITCNCSMYNICMLTIEHSETYMGSTMINNYNTNIIHTKVVLSHFSLSFLCKNNVKAQYIISCPSNSVIHFFHLFADIHFLFQCVYENKLNKRFSALPPP